MNSITQEADTDPGISQVIVLLFIMALILIALVIARQPDNISTPMPICEDNINCVTYQSP